jgi:hypothetical protein
MNEPTFHAKVLAWGGSIGLRMSKAEAKRLGLKVGQDFAFKPAKPGKIDLSGLPTFNLGGRLVEEHDRILGEARSKDLGLPPKK